ncbi:hypothetical protein [Methanosarcina mazei]|uniref:Glycosyltransferase RgtA/B/C/D-like domain-containing protein n=1 Tax=Methanosarcina mazei TaxID=2209 RepID=A0A0F8U3H9_METMZ|nr:hypothetical protein [Methanosarcina mazei]KKG06890.1 hypothetical protein DU47_10800 [Methanosarcina mazei]KKH85821.1 hypothetical protein DU80_18570 [Methanosarcina mazei]
MTKINRVLTLIAIVTNILNAFFLYFFKLSPILYNDTITNLLLLSSSIIYFMLLVYGTFLIEKSKDLFYLMPQSLVMAFTVRAIPNLRLSYPPLHDPYFYITSVINIVDFGTLTPHLLKWYYQLDVLLSWPSLHILTSEIILLSNVDTIQIMRYFNPLMGCIFLISVYILSYEITEDLKTSFVASLLASMGDLCVFYQSEYHPQGYSLIIYLFLIYIFFKSKQKRSAINSSLLLLFVVSFVTIHHFSSIFLALLFFEVLIFLYVVKYILPHGYLRNILTNEVKNIRLDINLVTFIVVFSISYHLFVYPNVMEHFIISATSYSPLSAQLINVGKSVPLYKTLISSSKWILFLLASISAINVIRKKENRMFLLLIILICILFAGILGNYVVNSPLDRIILFYIPVTSIFAASTIVSLDSAFSKKNVFRISFIFFIGLVLTAGVLNSQTPCYFFENSDVNADYWYSNQMPNMELYAATGFWIGNYTDIDSKYGTEFDTYIVSYFYASRPLENISFVNNYQNIISHYFIYNPKIPYEQDGLIMNKELLFNHHKIYNNNELEIIV